MGEGREIREGEIEWMSHFGSNVNAASFQSVNASIWKTNAIKLFQKLVFLFSLFLHFKCWQNSVVIF